MEMKLFDDVGEDDDNISKIEINKEFAKRYEHNKKREDLQRLEEMKKKGLVNDSDSDTESSSESDMDDDGSNLKSSKNEAKFLDALLKVRNEDPIMREKDAKLFESSSEDEDGDGDDDDDDDDDERGERKEKRRKPKYLKDVIAQQLIEKGPEFEEEEEEEERESGERVKSYVEEQEELRREVLDAMAAAERENVGAGEDFLKEKARDEGEGEEDEDEDEEEVKKRLDEYFGEDEKLDENDMFLKDFFRNKMWIDRDKGKNKVSEDDIIGFSEDEEWIEEQEDYERDINFRHEQQNVSDRVEGHSRRIEGSVRKETNARKQQRERKKERLAQAELERQEEVKRLKNLKRKEIQEKLNKIREIAGFDEGSIPFDEDDLEEDFDPVKFDEKLKNAYGDDYYEKEDVDPDFGNEIESDLEKPNFEREDELLGLPKDWHVIKSDDGFIAEREKIKKLKSENGIDQGPGGEADDEHIDEGKKKRKRKKSAIKEALDKEIEEELYQLDYEGSIGDLKTRFKYREVKPSKYGLSSADILTLDEKELNQYVSLKKLATYREQEWRVPQMKRQLLFQGLLSSKTSQKRKKRKDDDGGSDPKSGKEPMEVVKEQGDGQSVDESKLSRAARRRRRMKEKKLPDSRLIAYGKMPSISKNKKRS